MNSTHTNHTKLKNFLVKHSHIFMMEVFNYIDNTESLTGENISIEQGNNFVYWDMVKKQSMEEVFERCFDLTDETSSFDELAYYEFKEENFGLDDSSCIKKDKYRFFGNFLEPKQYERLVKRLNAGEKNINIFVDFYNDDVHSTGAFTKYRYRVACYSLRRKGDRIYVDRNLAKDKFFFQYLPNCEKKLENEDYLCNRAS